MGTGAWVMDVFFEQIVVRRLHGSEKVLKVLTFIFGVLAVLLLIFLSFLQALGAFSFILLPCAFGVGVLLFFQLRNTYIEYEYSITNGSFDIDRIRGKRKRERMVTVECEDFEEFGEYDKAAAERLKNRQFGGEVFASNRGDEGLYYAVSRHKKLGSVLIVIEPDNRVKTALAKFIPRRIQGNVFGSYGENRK